MEGRNVDDVNEEGFRRVVEESTADHTPDLVSLGLVHVSLGLVSLSLDLVIDESL